jgi:hypothetical protein
LQRHLGVEHAPEQDELLRRVNLLTAQQCRQLVKQSKDRDSAVIPQAEENSTAQMDWLRRCWRSHSRFSPSTIKREERRKPTAGVWRLSGKRYISSYDSSSQEFSLESLEDGGLRIRGQVEGDTVRVVEAQHIQANDMAAFREMRRILEAVPQTPSVKQAVQEL